MFAILNVDGSSLGNPGRSGFGGLLRHGHGGWIAGFLGLIREAEIIKAELLALLHVMEHAWERGFRDVICFFDLSSALLMVEQGVGVFQSYAPIVQSIRDGIRRD